MIHVYLVFFFFTDSVSILIKSINITKYFAIYFELHGYV